MRRSAFVDAVFKAVGGFETSSRTTFGVAWAAYEDTQAQNNPFATTEPWEGATEFNTAGVKNYPNEEAGIEATVKTLENGDYQHLLDMLRNPDASALELCNALNESPWGSKVSGALYNEVGADPVKYDIQVPGSSPDPVPDPETGGPFPKPSEGEEASAEAGAPRFTGVPQIERGENNRAVLCASILLHAFMSPGPAKDAFEYRSEFDVGMEEVVKEFQQEHDLVPDGIIGPKTWSAFFI